MNTMDDGRPFLSTSELEELKRLKRTLSDDVVMRIQEQVWRDHLAAHPVSTVTPEFPGLWPQSIQGLWRAFLQALRDAVRH